MSEQDDATTQNLQAMNANNAEADSAEHETDSVTETMADRVPGATPDSAADTIPLYTTTPPPPQTETSTRDYGQATQERDPASGTPANHSRGTGGPYPRSRPQQPYVYVPPVPAHNAQPEILLHKTGPSTATLVFGSFLLFIGVVSLLLSLHFPNLFFVQLHADPKVFVALMCAVAGVILVVVAVAWSLAKLIHGIGHRSSTRNADEQSELGVADEPIEHGAPSSILHDDEPADHTASQPVHAHQE